MRTTMLTGDPGPAASQSVHAHVLPPPPDNLYLYSIVNFTNRVIIGQAYRAFSTHVCDRTHLLVLIGLYHYELE
jgi:hypothetical protein